MRDQFVKMPVKTVSVRQIIAKAPKWVRVLGVDENSYLIPAAPETYSYEHAFCNSVLLNALGITTVDAAVLSLSQDLASQAGLVVEEESDTFPQQIIGWRLPRENAGNRLLQVLPNSWLPRIANREQFLEVLILDVWLGCTGQPEVVFRQSGQRLEAIFLPSGNPSGTHRSTMQEARYHQMAVYSGLRWAKIQSALKSKIRSLRLADLERRLRTLPQIGVRYEVLRCLWSETVVMEICFDHTLSDVMGSIFSGVADGCDQRIPEIPANHICAISNASRGYPLGMSCG